MGVKAFPAALSPIERAVEYQPDEPRLQLKLARVQAALNHPAQAAAAYQRALDLAPDNVEALANLAVLAVRGGEFETAKRYVQPLLVLSPTDLNGLLVSGAIAVEEKRFGEARRIAQQIATLAPDRSEGAILLARTEDAAGRPREALRILTGQAARDPDNPDLLAQLLQLQRRIGDRAGLQNTAIKLAKAFPDDPVLVIESARAFHARGQEDRVRATLAALHARLPRAAGVSRAIARFWQENYPNAIARREVAALASGASPAARAAVAGVLVELGAAPAALSLVRAEAAGEVAADTIEAHLVTARALAATGQDAAARARTDDIIDFDETNTAALKLRAELRLKQGDGAGALEDAQLAVTTDGEDVDAQLLVGRAFAALNRPTLANGAFGGALRHFPQNDAVVRAYAQWLIAQKRPEEAVRIADNYRRNADRRVTAAATFEAICAAAGPSACAAATRPRVAFY
jgi:Tfp pilus assembly protein PilF